MADELPTPPRWPLAPSERDARQRRAQRPRSLTKEAIVAAAVKVLDAEGLDAMTMRRVAQEFHTSASSLYAHVADKDELIELVVERVLGDLAPPGPPDPENWQEQVKQFGRAVRNLWAQHADLARASFARIPLGPNALRSSEALLAILRAAGISDRVVGYAADLLPLYVGAVAYEEGLFSQQDIAHEQFATYVSELHDYFAALPADQFPNLKALAAPLTSGTEEDERFEFGLEVLVRGIEAIGKKHQD
jgi:AcrR family transcriptional regulator